MFVSSYLYDAAVAAVQTGVAGTLHGALVGLYVNNIAPDKANVLGDFTEPIYTGYARVTLTWGAGYRSSDGSYRQEGGLAQFAATDDAHPTTVYGYFVVAVDGTTLLGAEQLASPIDLPDDLTLLNLVVAWIFSNIQQAFTQAFLG